MRLPVPRGWRMVLLAQATALAFSLLIGGTAAWLLRPAPPEPKSLLRAVKPLFVPNHLARALNTAPYHRRLPADWKKALSGADRKARFAAILRPLISLANARIGADRATSMVLFKKTRLSRRESWLLAALYHHYKVKPGRRLALLKRLDAVPQALVIAQAAIETGWGRSRFALEGNALFGEWTWNVRHMMVPKKRRPGLGKYGIRRFDSLHASVASYMKNLNSNKAYGTFRELRAHARAEGRRPTGIELAAGLSEYSERGETYIAMLRDIIRKEKLEVAKTESSS